MLAADLLEGKTIKQVESDEWDEFIIFFFTDNTCLVLTAERCNAAGAKIVNSFGGLAKKKEKK